VEGFELDEAELSSGGACGETQTESVGFDGGEVDLVAAVGDGQGRGAVLVGDVDPEAVGFVLELVGAGRVKGAAGEEVGFDRSDEAFVGERDGPPAWVSGLSESGRPAVGDFWEEPEAAVDGLGGGFGGDGGGCVGLGAVVDSDVDDEVFGHGLV
jgi:hypothetical protein